MNLSGVLVVNKPVGMTSFKVVSIVKKILEVKKVGHMGTLDPMATGVLPIMLGKATKILNIIENNSKEYIAGIKFGISTDTQDITGNITGHSDKIVEFKDLKNAISYFIGDIFQVPPMYSAIKKNGVKLYEIARKGEVIEREKRKITIKDIEILSFDKINQTANFKVKCSKGTYIRTLCSDLGEFMGCKAVMSSLIRTNSNGFFLDESITLDELERLIELKKDISEKIKPIDSIFINFPQIYVTDKQAIRFKNGGSLSIDRLNFNKQFQDFCKIRVYFKEEFLGIGEVDMLKNELGVFQIF